MKANIDFDKDKFFEIMRMDSERYREAFRKGEETGYTQRDEEIVRCKDCKHGEKCNSVYLCGKSRGFGIAHEQDWFCADGERRTE